MHYIDLKLKTSLDIPQAAGYSFASAEEEYLMQQDIASLLLKRKYLTQQDIATLLLKRKYLTQQDIASLLLKRNYQIVCKNTLCSRIYLMQQNIDVVILAGRNTSCSRILLRFC